MEYKEIRFIFLLAILYYTTSTRRKVKANHSLICLVTNDFCSELVRTQLTLPTTYKELQRNFHIIHKEAHIADSKASPMGDCLHVFKESAYDTVATIPKFDENAVSLDLVRTVIKVYSANLQEITILIYMHT
jgi:hypothetical protein